MVRLDDNESRRPRSLIACCSVCFVIVFDDAQPLAGIGLSNASQDPPFTYSYTKGYNGTVHATSC